MQKVNKRIFLFDEKARLCVAHAYALGATRALPNGTSGEKLLALLISPEDVRPGGRSLVASARKVASAGAAAFASMFSDVRNGSFLDFMKAEAVAGKIFEVVANDGMTNRLNTVRKDHEGTYQHRLLVSGIVAGFGLNLGMSDKDNRRLYTASMFHDLGKAKIPLRVLDKPGRLDTAERALIETRRKIGYDILNDTMGAAKEVLDVVRHHHELLDGSGYPDGLTGDEIIDIVRIVTIAVSFAALIEKRFYKLPMRRDEAYEIHRGMCGKLEATALDASRRSHSNFDRGGRLNWRLLKNGTADLRHARIRSARASVYEELDVVLTNCFGRPVVWEDIWAIP